jgi:hypothetical protein
VRTGSRRGGIELQPSAHKRTGAKKNDRIVRSQIVFSSNQMERPTQNSTQQGAATPPSLPPKASSHPKAVASGQQTNPSKATKAAAGGGAGHQQSQVVQQPPSSGNAVSSGQQTNPSKATKAAAGGGAGHQQSQVVQQPPSSGNAAHDPVVYAAGQPQSHSVSSPPQKKSNGAKQPNAAAKEPAPSQSMALVLADPVAKQAAPRRFFADVSNIWPGIQRSGLPLRTFLRSVQNLYHLDARIAFGSKTPKFANSPCHWETEFQKEGWLTRSELRPEGCKESMVDDCIAAHVYRAILDNRGERIVVLSGDGNQRNPSQVSIFDAILSALERKIGVELWCWRECLNADYKRLQHMYPSLFAVHLLDHCVPPPQPQPRPLPVSCSSFTITLRSAVDAIIPATATPLVEQCIRDDLKHVPGVLDAANGLFSTSASTGKSKNDFIFVNFRSFQSADAALQHYEKSKELNLQGVKYKVNAAWKKPKPVEAATAVAVEAEAATAVAVEAEAATAVAVETPAAERVAPHVLPDVNDMLGLTSLVHHTAPPPASDDNAEFFWNLINQPGGGQFATASGTVVSDILSLYQAAALPRSPISSGSSSGSDSDVSVDPGASSQCRDLMEFSDEGPQAASVADQSLLAPAGDDASVQSSPPLHPSSRSTRPEQNDACALLPDLLSGGPSSTGSHGITKTNLGAAVLLPVNSEGS